MGFRVEGSRRSFRGLRKRRVQGTAREGHIEAVLKAEGLGKPALRLAGIMSFGHSTSLCMYLSFYLSIYLPIYLSRIYLCVYVSIYISHAAPRGSNYRASMELELRNHVWYDFCWA